MQCRLLLISGSLRASSTNSATLRTAIATKPQGVEAVLYAGLATLPHFNPDDDARPLPTEVADLRSAIHAADALLFCTPEYAGALPGSFKNLLDWTIGDGEPESIYDKPVAWINVAPRGAMGAHDELRAVLGYAHATIVEEACVHVPLVTGAIGADGLIADPVAREGVARAVASLAESARSHRARRAAVSGSGTQTASAAAS